MQFFNGPTGRVWAGSPGAGDVFNGGFAFNPNKQLSRIAPAATDVWIGGVRVSKDGAIVIDTSLGASESNNGVPCSTEVGAEGAVYRLADTTPVLGDYPVCGGSLISGVNKEVMMSIATFPPIGAQQLINPEFTTDTTGWTTYQATLVWAAGNIQVVATVASSFQIEQTTLSPPRIQLGCSYACEASIRNIDTPLGPQLRATRQAPGAYANVAVSSSVPGVGFTYVSFVFTPRYSDLAINVLGVASVIGQSFEVEYVRLWLLLP